MKKFKIKLKTKSSLTGFMFTVPFLIGFVCFTVTPFIWSIFYSMTTGLGGSAFAGFENYNKLFGSEAFQLAVFNTGRFLLFGVPLLMLVSFVIALLFGQKIRGLSFLRSVFLSPLIVPIAMIIVVAGAFFGADGILNEMLSLLGLPVNDWLKSDSAFWVLTWLFIWKNCGYNIILFLVGLNSVPKELLDAASLDGANALRKLISVKLPLLMPISFFIFVMSIVNSFKIFKEAYALGGESPHKSIYMLQHFLNSNFANLNYQRLSAAEFLMFTAIALLVFLLFWRRQRRGNIEI